LARWLVERATELAVAGLAGVEDCLGADAHALRQFVDRGRSLKLTRQRFSDGSERDDQVLLGAGDVQPPGPVAQVSAQLTGDGRHRERAEPLPALGIKSIDRLHEAEARDLNQIVGRSPARPKTPRERPRQWQVLLDQGGPFARIAAPPRVGQSKLPAAAAAIAI
jgi:hypothetical protein